MSSDNIMLLIGVLLGLMMAIAFYEGERRIKK